MIAIGCYFVIIVSVMGMPRRLTDITNEEKEQLFQQILKEHNIYRSAHGSQDLRLNPYIKHKARIYLNEWTNGKSDIPNKSEVNTFESDVSKITSLDTEFAKKIVTEWYKTGNKYDYDVGPTSRATDPFTKIVWGSTTDLGVSMKENNDKFYLLAFYYPEGNEEEKYNDNVKKPLIMSTDIYPFSRNS